MSATRSPVLQAERDVAQDRAPAHLDRDAVGVEGGLDHSSYPSRARRSRRRKNGAPMTAVTTPTGHAAQHPRDDVGRRQEARPEQRGDRQDEAGVRADEQAHEVRHHEPDEADEAGDRHAGGRHERRERRAGSPAPACTSTPRCAAVSSPSRKPLSDRARSRISERSRR